MSKSERFKPIRKIAEKKERDAASAFGKTLRDREAAQQRLNELREYHAEYLQRFTQATRDGIGSARIREYQAFITKLELAIAEQENVLTVRKQTCVKKKAQWRGEFTKARAVEKALERMRSDELKQKEKREQALSDERAQRRR